MPTPMVPDLKFYETPGAQPDVPNANKIAELEAKIAGLSTQLSEAQRMSTAVAMTPAVKAIPQVPTEIDWSNMPDPVKDAPGYQAEVAKRVHSFNEAVAVAKDAAKSAAQTAEEKLATLREGFKKRYAGVKVRASVLDAYGEDAVKAIVAAEKDPRLYVFGQTDKFYDDIAARLREDGYAIPDPTQPGNGEDLRTAGINGGMESGGKPAKGKEPDDAAPADSFTSVRAFQQKHGWYA